MSLGNQFIIFLYFDQLTKVTELLGYGVTVFFTTAIKKVPESVRYVFIVNDWENRRCVYAFSLITFLNAG